MKLFLLCLYVLGIGSHSNAWAQIRWGVRLGLNSSSAVATLIPVSTYTPLTGPQAGVVAEIALGESISLQVAPSFTTKGFARSLFVEDNLNPTDQPYGSATIRIETVKPYYLELPVLVIFKAPLTEQVKLFTGLGPYLSLLTGGTIQYDYRGLSSKGQLSPTSNSVLSQVDTGLSGTTGVELFNRFQLGVRYDYGLLNVARSSQLYNIRNRSASLTLTAFL